MKEKNKNLILGIIIVVFVALAIVIIVDERDDHMELKSQKSKPQTLSGGPRSGQIHQNVKDLLSDEFIGRHQSFPAWKTLYEGESAASAFSQYKKAITSQIGSPHSTQYGYDSINALHTDAVWSGPKSSVKR